jgi:hypothetical protein
MTSVWMERKSLPKQRARMMEQVGWLREMGFSYEEIPAHLADLDDVMPTPWEVYELANPSKTAEQVAAWKARHHPHG